jgi:hypothetical protein
MSTLVNEATRDAVLDHGFQWVSNTFGATVVVLLLFLLVVRELVRVAREPSAAEARLLSVLIVPLLVAFVFVEVARIAYVIL